MIASKRLTFLFLGVLLPEVDKWLNSAGDCCRDGLRALIWTLTKRAQKIHSSKSSKSVVMLWKVRWSDPSSWSGHMFFNSFGSMYIWLCLNTHWTLPYTSSLIRKGFYSNQWSCCAFILNQGHLHLCTWNFYPRWLAVDSIQMMCVPWDQTHDLCIFKLQKHWKLILKWFKWIISSQGNALIFQKYILFLQW